MSAEHNKSIVRRFIEEVLNRGEIDIADGIVDVDYVRQSSRERAGLEGVKRFAAAQRAAAPDWHITIEDMVAEGDKVAVRAFGSGTPQRVYAGMPPEAVGRRITVPWIAIYRLKEGKIAEGWVVSDRLGVLQQAGLIGPTERAAGGV